MAHEPHRDRRIQLIAAGCLLLLVLGLGVLREYARILPVDTGAGDLLAASSSYRPPVGNVPAAAHVAGADAESPASAPAQFRDPFYAFLVEIAERDSLGLWTRADIAAAVARRGDRSKLPIERIQSIRREAVTPSAEARRGGRSSERRWEVVFDARLDYPMPYRVLGRDLGSLDVARILVFSEWRLGECRVYAPRDGQVTPMTVTDLIAFRLETGWIVMDVAGLVDQLLGRKLDDCWTRGFAICRREGRLCGLAVSCNRDLQPVCGEIDFATNEIIPSGRPLARGVATYLRPWLQSEDDRAGAWRYQE